MSRIDGGNPYNNKELGIRFEGFANATVGETGEDGEFRYNGQTLAENREWWHRREVERENRGRTSSGDAWKDASGEPEAQGYKGEGPGKG